MKKQVSLKLSPEMLGRVMDLVESSRLKKNTVIEMCFEVHLSLLEKDYEDELAKYRAAKQKEPDKKIAGRKTSYPTHASQGNPMNDKETKR